MFDLVIVKTKNRGKGVLANRNFRKREFITEFRGKIYIRKDKPMGFNSKNNHYMQIDKDKFIGPCKTADNFINHSCNPNSAVIVDSKRAFLVALKKIRKGQEITFDYSLLMYKDTWSMECKCGNMACRKIIREFKFLPNKLKLKYMKLGIVPTYVLN